MAWCQVECQVPHDEGTKYDLVSLSTRLVPEEVAQRKMLNVKLPWCQIFFNISYVILDELLGSDGYDLHRIGPRTRKNQI